jgi:glycosyltransferase involved in cell wall biosynthesis
MITVFIPAYNAHDFIDYAIMSLINQTLKDLIKVVIINDGSVKDYSLVLQKFSPYINIKEITLKKNMGIGYVRQVALNNLDTKYFAFLDADDIYIDGTTFEFFYTQMENNPNYVAISGQVYEETGPYSYKLHEDVNYWVFAKLYRSSFIIKNNLSFPPTNGNEDNIFNIAIGGCLKDDEIVMDYDRPIYLWKFNKNSITRKNNFEHWFHGSPKGLIDGIYYIKDNKNINAEHLNNHIKLAFFNLYFTYHDNIVHRKGEFSKEILHLAKKVYNDFLKEDLTILEEEKIKIFFSMIVTSFQKPYEDVNMFREFVEIVKQLE